MPTPVYDCTAECGQAGTVGQHFVLDGVTTPAVVTTTTPIAGLRSWRCTPAGGVTSSFVTFPSAQTGGAATVKVVGFSVRFDVMPTADVVLAMFISANGHQGVYFKQSDSKIYAGSLAGIGATGVTVALGKTYWISARDNVAANPKLCDVTVTDLADLTVSTACGQRSDADPATTIANIDCGFNGFYTGQTSDLYFDDFVCSVTSGDYPIAPQRGQGFVAVADGTHNVAGAADFRRGNTTTDITNSTTDAYLLVDDVPMDDATPDTDDHIRIVAPPNVTDYVELIWGPISPAGKPNVAPYAVECIIEVFAAGTLASDEIFRLNDGGSLSVVYDGTGVAGVGTGTYKRAHFATPPSGGAWTPEKFNALRYRYGYATDANPDKSLMCAMIEALFPRTVSIPHEVQSHSARAMLVR